MKLFFRLPIPAIAMVLFTVLSTGCSVQQKINKTAQAKVLNNSSLAGAHVGISFFEPATQKYWYTHQADKYFVPASNIKLFSLFAGMKYLGDSLPGLRYIETDKAIYLQPTGDPSLLHPDFAQQPLVQWLQQTPKQVFINASNWHSVGLGYGWSWDDYSDYYMAERSALPVYGNIIKWTQVRKQDGKKDSLSDNENYVYAEPEINWKVNFSEAKSTVFSVQRKREENVFNIIEGKDSLSSIDIPFLTNGIASALELLKDTLHKQITSTTEWPKGKLLQKFSQPTDTLFSRMMHRSDNFYAEQTLLMAANKKLGVMDEHQLIDTLLKTDLKNLPQLPNWVDGSGLSRYNLFSPNDFIWILQTLKNEFGWQRISHILPSGNEGTLRNYYKILEGNLYAKTGTLSGQVAISGYFTTKKNKQLIFSVLVNNHHSSASAVRRAVEQMIVEVYNSY